MDNLPHVDNSESLAGATVGGGPELAGGSASSGQPEGANEAATVQHAQEILANSSNPHELSDTFYSLKWQNRSPEQSET